MFKATDRSAGELNGFLDAGSHIQGELVFEDTFRVDGKLTGTVRSDGDLVVGERGEIDADVRVGRLFVSGVLRGTAQATERIELSPTARVEATLTAPSLAIEAGAKIDGHCIAGAKSTAEDPADRPKREAQAAKLAEGTT